jgi:F-type H+-transporting ATPase subunit gamma
MALQAKAIKQKIKGVGNIKKITRTMEMVSVSKMKKSTTSAALIQEYSDSLTRVLAHVSKKVRSDSTFFNVSQNATRELIVIVSSNKGLAGSYNTNIYKKLLTHIQKTQVQTDNIDVVTIGKQAEKIAKRLRLNIVLSYIHISDSPKTEEGEEVWAGIFTMWKKGVYSYLNVISTHFIKPGVFSPEVTTLLPVTNIFETHEVTEKGYFKDTIFEPSQGEIINTVVPRLLGVKMYSLLVFAAASEHSSRMFAMKTASDNAAELQRVLTISYNKARQDAVTQELAEIAAGSL